MRLTDWFPRFGRSAEASPVTAVTGPYEKEAMAGSLRRHLRAVPGPKSVTPDDDFVAWADRDVEAIGKKNKAKEKAKAIMRSRRPRARAASDRALAQSLKKLILKLEELAEKSAVRLDDAMDALDHLAVRGITARALKFRKAILAVGDVVGVALAMSIALDIPLLYAFLMSVAIGPAIVFLGADLGAELKLASERHRMVSNEGLKGDSRYAYLTDPAMLQPKWLRIVGGASVIVLLSAGLAVGVLRAEKGGLIVALALVALTIVVSWAAGSSAWRFANLAAEIIDYRRLELIHAQSHLERVTTHKILRRHERDRERVAIATEIGETEGEAHTQLAEAEKCATRSVNPEIFTHGVRDGSDTSEDDESTAVVSLDERRDAINPGPDMRSGDREQDEPPSAQPVKRGPSRPPGGGEPIFARPLRDETDVK